MSSPTPPSELQLFGKVWQIKFTKIKDLGDCEVVLNRIRVNPKQSADSRRDTLLHEIVHAVEHELLLNMTEKQVSRLATGLLSMLRTNPGVVDFLLEP